MKVYYTVVILAVSATVTMAAPQRFDGYSILRVEAKTHDHVAQLESLGAVILNCHPAPGKLDILIPPAAKEEFDRLNLPTQVLLEDAQSAFDFQDQMRAQGPIVAGGDPFLNYFDDYRPYNGSGGVVWYMNELVSRYPGLASMVNVGLTLEGRTIWGLRVTSNVVSSKPAVVYFGVEHAREWITATVPPFFAKTLLENYGTDAFITDLVDNVEFFLIPVFNVDGYEYTWTTNRLWRKNRRPNPGGTFGVDLNRNWGEGWGGPGSSGTSSSEVYRGTAPFSEPETQRLRDFLIAHPNVRAQLDIHSYSQLILWPFAGSSSLPADQYAYQEVGQGMQLDIFGAHGLQYAAGPVYTTIYPASGGSVDWTYVQRGIFSFSYELRDNGTFGFTLPADQIAPQLDEIIPAMLRLSDSDWVRMPLRFEFPDGIPGHITAGQDEAITVRIVNQTDFYRSGTGKMLYRYDPSGPYLEVPLTSIGGDLYEAVLPATNCTSAPEFYFSAQSENAATVHKPRSALAGDVYHATVSSAMEVFFNEPLSANPGWTTEGQWAFGDPAGTGGDPQTGHTGNFVYGYNLSGQYTNLMPVHSLTSPPIDCTGRKSVHLTFWRWLGVETASWDKAAVMVSSDGVNWTPVWQSSSQITDNAWVFMDLDISSVADNQPAVYLRWTMGPTDGVSVFAGWNIDDISLYSHICNGITSDYNGDGLVNTLDYSEFTACYSGENIPRPAGCAVFDSEPDGDVDCADFNVLRDNWTDPGAPPAYENCPYLAAPIALAAGSRYISITPASHPVPISLQVLSPDLPCLSAYVDFDPDPELATQGLARLVGDPVYRTASQWSTVYLGDADIVPDTTYEVLAGDGAGLVSDVATVRTVRWGDVALPYDVVDIRDVAGTVDIFREVPGAPSIVRGDAYPQVPDYTVNISDITATVDAFKELTFPYVPPSTCP